MRGMVDRIQARMTPKGAGGGGGGGGGGGIDNSSSGSQAGQASSLGSSSSQNLKGVGVSGRPPVAVATGWDSYSSSTAAGGGGGQGGWDRVAATTSVSPAPSPSSQLQSGDQPFSYGIKQTSIVSQPSYSVPIMPSSLPSSISSVANNQPARPLGQPLPSYQQPLSTNNQMLYHQSNRQQASGMGGVAVSPLPDLFSNIAPSSSFIGGPPKPKNSIPTPAAASSSLFDGMNVNSAVGASLNSSSTQISSSFDPYGSSKVNSYLSDNSLI